MASLSLTTLILLNLPQERDGGEEDGTVDVGQAILPKYGHSMTDKLCLHGNETEVKSQIIYLKIYTFSICLTYFEATNI